MFSSKKVCKSGPYHKFKKITASINDSKYINTYREESKSNEALTDKRGLFHTVIASGSGGTNIAAQKHFWNIYPYLTLKTVFEAPKLRQSF